MTYEHQVRVPEFCFPVLSVAMLLEPNNLITLSSLVKWKYYYLRCLSQGWGESENETQELNGVIIFFTWNSAG